MYQTKKVLVPTANVAIKKSRLKLYKKDSKQPIYYLENGSEFQIELFNPTQNTVLAKISIDGKAISQTGLVLRPGERVFLDRYLDVAKRFKFSTYTVSNTEEVQNAISNNGELKIEFFNEYEEPIKINLGGINNDFNKPGGIPSFPPNPYYIGDIFYNTSNTSSGSNLGDYTLINSTFDDITTGDALTENMTTISTYSTTAPLNNIQGVNKRKLKRSLKSSKKIETGQVEKGSNSTQEMTYVDKTFNVLPFHIVNYKLLPTSQKNVTSDELVSKYCTKCGKKTKKGDNFCSACGNRL